MGIPHILPGIVFSEKSSKIIQTLINKGSTLIKDNLSAHGTVFTLSLIG